MRKTFFLFLAGVAPRQYVASMSAVSPDPPGSVRNNISAGRDLAQARSAAYVSARQHVELRVMCIEFGSRVLVRSVHA